VSPKPMVASRQPAFESLKPGEHYWRACGRSESQPSCYASHAGTGFEPKAFTVEADADAASWMCKHTAQPL
jgi:CDGSH-type Zn-finger protein